MKIKKLLPFGGFFALIFSMQMKAQVPTASFAVNPTTVCSGTANSVQITDFSTGSPASWSYTVSGFGPGGGTTLSASNPTISFNGAGIFTITLVVSNSSGSSTPFMQTLTVLPSPNGNINPNNTTTCPGGNPITLSFGGGPGGAGNTVNWSTGVTSSSIVVTPSVTTVYSCVVTGTNGCSTLRTATITVGPATATITSNPVFLCPGTSSTLTATGSAPGPFTYSWSTGVTTRTISTNITGVYDVTVTNANGCSAVQTYSLGSSTTLSLTATYDPTVLCAGNTATLHVTGATSYSWDTGAAAANVTVNPTSNTTYTVNGLVGTCTGSTTVQVSVNVTPTVSALSSYSAICSGNSVMLTASGANTYTWLPSTLGQTVNMTPTISTTYVVRGNNPGCPSRTAAVAVTVYSNPAISVSSSSATTCAGEMLALAVFGADTYTWNTGSNASVYIVQPTITTSYSVIGASVNGCTTIATITQTVNVCAGIQETGINTKAVLHVFPNPGKGNIRIELIEEANCFLFDQTGKLLETFKVDSGFMEISELSTGVYYLRANTSSAVYTQKIVVINND